MWWMPQLGHNHRSEHFNLFCCSLRLWTCSVQIGYLNFFSQCFLLSLIRLGNRTVSMSPVRLTFSYLSIFPCASMICQPDFGQITTGWRFWCQCLTGLHRMCQFLCGSIAPPCRQPSYSYGFVDYAAGVHLGSRAGQFPGQVSKHCQ